MLKNFTKNIEFAEIYDNAGMMYIITHKSMKSSNAKNITVKFNRLLNLYEITGDFVKKIKVCENNGNEQTDLFIGKTEADLEINEELIENLKQEQELFQLINIKPKDLYILPQKMELSDELEYHLMLRKGFYEENVLNFETIYSSCLIIK